MVFFLLGLNTLRSISSLVQPICQPNILVKDLFQVGIWEIDAVIILGQFLPLPLRQFMLEMFAGRILFASPEILYYSTCTLSLKICSKLLVNEL